ncbi:P-protein [Hypsizygus marmoreus]|uniref:prephenate dehydratase n=1 Tax=Hypsizygus marmoreus TaxID=39966 RepID=A0A369K4F1_HYPMA|nr:P-protein [Hypsizygus marmoreus]
MQSRSANADLNVAILGPLGTYTHEAAYKHFGSQATYVERETIKGVFEAISTGADVGVVPQENTIFGSVVETYDNLRETGFVCGEITLQVQHCLLVRTGVQLPEIRKVLSHEQALGQCRDFISTNLPTVSLMKTTSTAAAAQALLGNPPDRAAICSRVCATLFDGLSVLHEGIQNETANFTRFYIICKDQETTITPQVPRTPRSQALVRISPQLPSSTASSVVISPPSISRLLSALQINIIRIDRRPSLGGIPFHDTYLVELQEEPSVERDTESSWLAEVVKAVQRVEEAGGIAHLIGFW